MDQKKQLQIKATDDALRGHYANLLQVSNTKEEFILDFFLAHPPAGQLISRIIVSPGHIKRIVGVLQERLKDYETQHGTIEQADAPKSGDIGFKSE